MNHNTRSARDKIVGGVAALTVANIIVKLLGVLYKIPLVRIIGDDGMGYFNAAYTVFTLFYMISTAGLPVAVSILVSEARAGGNYPRSRKILFTALGIFVALGTLGSAALYFLSAPLADLIGSPLAVKAMSAIAPTLIFVCVSSALRGYFQGHQKMTPTAVSQVIEAFGKLIFGILLASFAIKKGATVAEIAAYTAAGLAVSEALSMVYLLVRLGFFRAGAYYQDDNKAYDEKAVSGRVVAPLLKIALPITVSAAMMSITGLIDLTVVMRRLQSVGFSVDAANLLYGNYTGLAVPMFNLPPVLIYPIAYAIVPYISAAVARGERQKVSQTVNLSLKTASLIGLPCTVGLSLLAGPILRLLFPEQSANMAALPLSVLACAVFFVGILAVTTSILQSLHKAHIPMIGMGIGAVIKIASEYFLIGIFGIVGAPLSSVLCYAAAAVINLFFVCKYTGVIPKIFDTFLRPAIASALCGGAAFGIYLWTASALPEWAATLLSIAVAGAVYLAAIVVLGGVKKEELGQVLGRG